MVQVRASPMVHLSHPTASTDAHASSPSPHFLLPSEQLRHRQDHPTALQVNHVQGRLHRPPCPPGARLRQPTRPPGRHDPRRGARLQCGTSRRKCPPAVSPLSWCVVQSHIAALPNHRPITPDTKRRSSTPASTPSLPKPSVRPRGPPSPTRWTPTPGPSSRWTTRPRYVL